MIIYHDLRRQPLFKPYFEASGIPHANHFRSKYTMLLHKILKLFPALGKRIPIKFMYTDPVCCPDDDKIIVFDSAANARYLNWLCHTYRDKRVILWFWNPAKNMDNYAYLHPRVECWSYCKRDAKEYGMLLNTQFYFDCLAQEAEAACSLPAGQPPRALFIGREKGREDKLKKLSKSLAENGIIPDFRLIYPPKYSLVPSLRENLIPYREVVDAVKASQIIVDLYVDAGAGLSLRAMEALFFRKKLITNRSLMRGEDFYNSQNIYILGHESRSIKEFLEETYADVDPAIRDRYLLSNWLTRFEKRRPKNDKIRKR